MSYDFNPLVTIITPCYNDGDYIVECVKSVQESSYKNIEHIIVDDGSDDYTKQILSKIPYTNVQIIYQTNNGVCCARNSAIMQARGEIILPVDGDDKIGKDYIGKAVKVFGENPNVRIVASEISQYFGLSNSQLKVKRNLNVADFLSKNMICSSSFFYRNDAIKVGGFDEDFKKGLEDWNFWVSLLELGGEIGVVPGTNVFIRVKRSSRNKSFSSETMRELVKLIWEKHKPLYSEYYADPYETDSYLSLLLHDNMSWSKLTLLRLKAKIRRLFLELCKINK